MLFQIILSLIACVPFAFPLQRIQVVEDLADEKIRATPVNFTDAEITRTDVTFKLFIKEEEVKGRLFDEHQIGDIILNRHLPAKFFIHGFRASSNVTWYGLLKRAYFRRGPYNIFYVDWSRAAFKSYAISAANVKPAGEIIADFILASKIALDRVHIIGNTLGAMVAGFTGKWIIEQTRQKVGRITGCDPESAKFEHRLVNSRMRLSAIDAAFVDIIHTDMNGLGFSECIGHVDFFPNGGEYQPDCHEVSESLIHPCSHRTAMLYFIESVIYPIYRAKKCDSWKFFLKGYCYRNIDVLFGEHTNDKMKGSFFYYTIRTPVVSPLNVTSK